MVFLHSVSYTHLTESPKGIKLIVVPFKNKWRPNTDNKNPIVKSLTLFNGFFSINI